MCNSSLFTPALWVHYGPKKTALDPGSRSNRSRYRDFNPNLDHDLDFQSTVNYCPSFVIPNYVTNNVTLEDVDDTKHLGVHYDKLLLFDKHTQKSRSKARVETNKQTDGHDRFHNLPPGTWSVNRRRDCVHTASAWSWSTASLSISTSVSSDFCLSSGSRATSSTFMLSMRMFVSSSFVSPFLTRSRAPTSCLHSKQTHAGIYVAPWSIRQLKPHL